jgi:Ca2+-transporting ATPase
MESYLNENFGVKPKHSSEEVLQKWRNLCGVVKNPKRRFRFTANLSKRYEAAAMRRTNQASLLSFNLFHFMIWSFYFNQTSRKPV